MADIKQNIQMHPVKDGVVDYSKDLYPNILNDSIYYRDGLAFPLDTTKQKAYDGYDLAVALRENVLMSIAAQRSMRTYQHNISIKIPVTALHNMVLYVPNVGNSTLRTRLIEYFGKLNLSDGSFTDYISTKLANMQLYLNCKIISNSNMMISSLSALRTVLVNCGYTATPATIGDLSMPHLEVSGGFGYITTADVGNIGSVVGLTTRTDQPANILIKVELPVIDLEVEAPKEVAKIDLSDDETELLITNPQVNSVASIVTKEEVDLLTVPINMGNVTFRDHIIAMGDYIDILAAPVMAVDSSCTLKNAAVKVQNNNNIALSVKLKFDYNIADPRGTSGSYTFPTFVLGAGESVVKSLPVSGIIATDYEFNDVTAECTFIYTNASTTYNLSNTSDLMVI